LYESGDRLEKVWGESAIQQMIETASTPLVDAMMLALWTGQREGDLLKLKWSDYDGKYIRLIQSKTIRHGKKGKAKRVTIPVSGPLKTYLDASKKRGIYILMNTRDQPWTEDGFRSSWGKGFDNAGINEDLTFHDLRGSAVIRLALAGSTVPEIATFTGHSLKDVENILDKHYLGRDVRLAESAARKLEAMFQNTTFSNTVERLSHESV
jgi:integrase